MTGLVDDLAEFDTRITNLETLLPGTASLPAGVAPLDELKIELPPTSEILFARDATTGAPIIDATKLPTRGAFLLPGDQPRG
ncbi:MAG: hypothetical protein WDN28_10215 [Chthoniobacter sp.]